MDPRRPRGWVQRYQRLKIEKRETGIHVEIEDYRFNGHEFIRLGRAGYACAVSERPSAIEILSKHVALDDRIELVAGDITTLRVDAIVNAANESLLGGGGVDGAIHRGAGPSLLEECRKLNGCKTGDAKLTRGHRLPAKYVIHTVGPVWREGTAGESDLLASCYRRCLELAVERGAKTIAFPAISCGAFGYPLQKASSIALGEARRFLERNASLERVTFVCFDQDTLEAYQKEKSSSLVHRVSRETAEVVDVEQLRSVIARAMTVKGYVGLCQISEGAHGYSFDGEIIQVADGRFLASAASDLEGALPDVSRYTRVNIRLDLRDELEQVRAAINENGSRSFYDDPASGLGGRQKSLTIAVGEDVEYLTFRGPLCGDPFRDTAICRLYRAVWGWPGIEGRSEPL